MIKRATWRNQGTHTYAFCWTAASLHKSYPTLQCKGSHHQGSKKHQKFPQKSRFLAFFHSLTRCCRHGQNLQAQPPPKTARLKRNGLTELPPCCPWELKLELKGFLGPTPCRFCLGFLLQRLFHSGAMRTRMSSPGGLPLWQPSARYAEL